MKQIVLKYFFKILSVRWQSYRVMLYKFLSENSFTGSPNIKIPLQTVGKGIIRFEHNCNIGVYPSPYFYTGSAYIESRNIGSEISIGENVFINNNFVMICDRTKIHIGRNTLIGTNVQIYDSDFHELHPEYRNSGDHICKEVLIGENVFIASNVTILKGVTIGNNAVIGNNSLVITDVPENTVFAGIPAKFIKNL